MSTRPKRRPRPVRIPVMRELADLFGLQLHCSYATLASEPTREAFDAIATCLNVVGLAIEHQPRHAQAAERINAAARALNQIAPKVDAIAGGAPLRLRVHELLPIELGVSAADALIPRLGVDQLHAARLRLRAINARERAREQAGAAQA